MIFDCMLRHSKLQVTIKIARLTPLDNVIFFISNGVDIADSHQLGAYTNSV